MFINTIPDPSSIIRIDGKLITFDELVNYINDMDSDDDEDDLTIHDDEDGFGDAQK